MHIGSVDLRACGEYADLEILFFFENQHNTSSNISISRLSILHLIKLITSIRFLLMTIALLDIWHHSFL